jgi:hypothetical protein
MPDFVIDGRQQYQQFGVWTWLAGSYPHPTTGDEQPASFKAIPDLHTDRVSAARQRYAAYKYAVIDFAPPELVPGFIGHQTQRFGPQGFTREPFRTRDWDTLGWRYSVLSTIATAPYALVVDMIPARDSAEYAAMSDSDKAWFREWIQWPDKHLNYIRNTRPILGQPMLGKVDGTSMIDGDKGYVFLFNPAYRRVNAEFRLDDSIGLARGRRWVLRQIYPEPKRLLLGPSSGVWSRGDSVSLPMEGTSAIVLQIEPAKDIEPLTLFGVGGVARYKDEAIAVDGVEAEMGSLQEMAVVVPHGAVVRTVTVDDKIIDFKREHDLITARLQFKERRFSHSQSLGVYSPAFAGRTFHSEFVVPRRVFQQLALRKKAWPVPYTADDLLAPWLGSDRLLIFVQIADANDRMVVHMKIDGEVVELKKAYSSIYGDGADRTFLGFYADVSDLDPDERHGIVVSLPELKPGQFQGVFFDNVETETTDEIYGKGEKPEMPEGEGD